MSTLAELVSQVRDYMKSDPNDKIWGTSVKESAVKSAYFQLQKDGNFNWPENQALTTGNTSAGTAEYSLPSDFIRLDLAQFTDVSGELYPYTKTTALRNSQTGQGRPSNYYIWNQKLGFYPTPDTSYKYRLQYRKKLADLSSSQDSELPTLYDDAIVRYASYILWSTTKNAGKSRQALQDYDIFLNQLKTAYLYQDTANASFPYQRDASRRYKYDPKILNFWT